MEEIKREIGSPSSSAVKRNYLRQFSIQEITTPMTLAQQEQLADKLIEHIKQSEQEQLPDYLEEFKRGYEGPNHLEVQLPVLSQLTPRTRRKLAVLPKPTEYELQKVRAIERSTKGKSMELYEALSKKQRMPKSQLTLHIEGVEVINPPDQSLIPPHTKAQVVSNKAHSYYEHVDSVRKHEKEQEMKIERLFSQAEKGKGEKRERGRLETRGEGNAFGERRSISSSGKKSARRSPSPTSLPLLSSSTPLLTPLKPPTSPPRSPPRSPSLQSHPLSELQPIPLSSKQTNPPSSSSSLSRPPSRLPYTPVPSPPTTLSSTLQKNHKSFLQSFSLQVYKQMGIHLDPTYNTSQKYTRALAIIFLYFQQTRLFSAYAQWKNVFEYSRELEQQKASEKIFKALRHARFISVLALRVKKRTNEKLAHEKRVLENKLFLQKMGRVIYYTLFRYLQRSRIKLRLRRRRAAMKIQSVVRGRIQRKKYKVKYMEYMLRKRSVIKIQRKYRDRLALRKALLARKLSFVEYWISALERTTRIYKHNYTLRGAYSRVVAMYKRYKMVKQLHNLVYYHRILSSIIIQKYYRRHRVYKFYLQKKRDQLEEFNKQLESAILLQKYIRRYLGVKRVENILREKEKERIEKYNHKLLLLSGGGGSGGCWKGTRHRMKYRTYVLKSRLLVQEASARKIQRAYRGYHGRKRADVIRVKKQVEKVNREREKRRGSTVKIQKMFRGYRARKHLHIQHLHRSATLIQSVYRMHTTYLRFLKLRRLHLSAKKITAYVRRAVVRHRFHLQYTRQQYLGRHVLPIQSFFRTLLAKKKIRKIRSQRVIQAEKELNNYIYFIHLLSRVQYQLLLNTTHKPIHHRLYSVSGMDCVCFGPIQALFVIGMCNNPNRTDLQSLATNRVDNSTFNKFFTKFFGFTQSNNPAVTPNTAFMNLTYLKNSYSSQHGGLYPSLSGQEKERIYREKSTLSSALLTELLMGEVPLPTIVNSLSSIDMDILFTKSLETNNVSHKLTYKELLVALEYMAKKLYTMTEKDGEEDKRVEERVEENKVEQENNVEMENKIEETIIPDRKEDLMIEEFPIEDQKAFNLQEYVKESIQEINKKSGYFSATRIIYPHSLSALFDPSSKNNNGVDYRIAILLRLLVYLRQEEYVKKIWAWLDIESRARLGLLVTRIQSLVRKAIAFRRVEQRRKELDILYREQMKEYASTKIQSLIRKSISYRKVEYLAQKVLRKYIPFLQTPYYYHPYTKVKSYSKPKILHDKDCYCLALPDKSLEQVIYCYACHIRSAQVNCLQCEESMCRICFDSLHCKGERQKHKSNKIPHCGYCSYQIATRSCLTCFLSAPKKGHIKESVPAGSRGLYCDTCFQYEHDSTYYEKLEKNPKYRDALQQMLNFSKETYLLSSYLRHPIVTKHTYEPLVAQCEECQIHSASWRCIECFQVYCHACLIGYHSKNQAFLTHKLELLPYYTKEMHESFRNDILTQEFNTMIKRVRKQIAMEREEMQYYCAIMIQSWYRMIYYGRQGRKKMKKQRQKQRKSHRLRKLQDAIRNTWDYRYKLFWGRAPVLLSDTREERILNQLPAWKRNLAKTYIQNNKEDWGYYRKSRTVPRKGIFKTGFNVGSMEELYNQAVFGGYRLPGYVMCKQYERVLETTCDLRNLLNPGEIVRIKNRLFGVVLVEKTSVKLTRCWRHVEEDEEEGEGAEGAEEEIVTKSGKHKEGEDKEDDDNDNDSDSGSSKKSQKKKKKTVSAEHLLKGKRKKALVLKEVLYRMPTYKNEPKRFSTAWRYRFYALVYHNPLSQILFVSQKMYHTRWMRWALYFYQSNKARNALVEAAEWKERAFQAMERAKYFNSFLISRDAFVNLSNISREDMEKKNKEKREMLQRIEDRKSKKERRVYSDDEEDGLGIEEGEEEGDMFDENGEKKYNKRMSRSRDGGEDIDDILAGGLKSKPSTSSKRFGAKSMATILAENKDESRPLSPTSSRPSTSSLFSSLSPFRKVEEEEESHSINKDVLRRRKDKLKRQTYPTKPWYATAEQDLARKEREDKMSLEDLAKEAGEWKECVDIMTENIYYLHIKTNEMMATMPRAVAAKRTLDFEQSTNKKNYDQAQERIARLEKVTKGRLLLTGTRKKMY